MAITKEMRRKASSPEARAKAVRTMKRNRRLKLQLAALTAPQGGLSIPLDRIEEKKPKNPKTYKERRLLQERLQLAQSMVNLITALLR